MTTLTKVKIDEYIKCRDDIVYFAEKYIKIPHPVKGIHTIVLNDIQLNILDRRKKYKVFSELCGRQIGKTTVASIIILHDAIFKDYSTTAIISTTQSYSNEKISLISFMWKSLPEFLAPKITKKIKSRIAFANGSEIIAAANVDRLRGMGIHTIYIDESEWVKNLSYIIECLYPVVMSGGRGTLFALSSTRTKDVIKEITH
jgi:hypothetical protein